MQTIKTILPQTSYNENNQPLVVEYEYGSSILYEYDNRGIWLLQLC